MLFASLLENGLDLLQGGGGHGIFLSGIQEFEGPDRHVRNEDFGLAIPKYPRPGSRPN